MFTGIIEEIGRVFALRRQGTQAMEMTIGAQRVLDGVRLGDSIAVNGVCLTVTRFEAGRSFSVDVMPETMKRTNLGELQPGAPVNLERAMTPTSRFGGHFVSGHVDATGRVVSRTPVANAVLFEFAADESFLQQLVPKGSVAVDGISLTVVNVYSDRFSVSIIPHTLTNTILQYKQVGDTVNLESDMLGKYVRQYLQQSGLLEAKRGLSWDDLKNNGFM